jgi:hypothetical protein
LSTVYRGRFRDGRVSDLELVGGLAAPRRGIVIFDAEISADGQTLYGAEGDLTGPGGPKWARLFEATHRDDGFHRLPESDRQLAEVNRDSVQYAPDLSADELTLYYTRVTGFLFWRTPQIVVATRPSAAVAFGVPHPVAAISGFAEAPSISSDGNTLYFHKLVGNGYRIFPCHPPALN